MTSETPEYIALPGDPYRVRQLEAKLEEYQNRTGESAQRETSIFRQVILRRLLNEHEVDVGEFWRQIQAEDPEADRREYEIAAFVIHDYTATGGRFTRGGTGLPDVHEETLVSRVNG